MQVLIEDLSWEVFMDITIRWKQMLRSDWPRSVALFYYKFKIKILKIYLRKVLKCFFTTLGTTRYKEI